MSFNMVTLSDPLSSTVEVIGAKDYASVSFGFKTPIARFATLQLQLRADLSIKASQTTVGVAKCW